MRTVESLQAVLERQLIRGLVRATLAASREGERLSHLAALDDLVRHADPSLDSASFDDWTRMCLKRFGLWIWAPPPPARMRDYEE